MANINLAGVLRDPLGEYSYLNKIRFTHTTTTGQTLAGFRSVHKVAEDGSYDIDLEYGNVFIETNDRLNTRWIDHGTITINSDTPATDLPSLLGITTPVTDPDLLVIQALVEDANQYAQASEASAIRAEDAAAEAELVAGSSKMVARALNITNSEVVEVEAGALLDGVTVVYDPTQELSYYLDDKVGTGETITSLTGNVLVTSGGTYYLRIVPDASTTLPVPVVTALNGNELETRVDGGITFTRATTRYNLNKSGVLEELAIDEAGVTKDGFSFYGDVTNLLTYSEDLSQPDWTKTRTTVATDGTVSVNPNVDAYLLTQTDPTQGYIRQLPPSSLALDDKVVQFCFVKPGSSSIAGLRLALTGDTAVFGVSSLDMSTEVFSLDSKAVDGGYEKCNDGWYLIWHCFENTSSNTAIDARFYPNDSSTVADGDSVYIQHAQVSISSCLVPYVKTEAAQSAATADLCQFPVMNNLPVAGKSFSISIESNLPLFDEENKALIRLESVVSSGLFIDRAGGDAVRFGVSDGAVSVVVSVDGIDSGKHDFCMSYDGEFIYAYVDGALCGSEANLTAAYDVFENITVGSNPNSTQNLDSDAENLRIYHSALTAKQVSKEFVK